MEPVSLSVHKLVSSTEGASETLSRILAFSNTIFAADPSSKYASLAVWQERFSAPAAFIICLAPSAHSEQPVAFLFAYRRSHDPPLQQGESHSLHVWLAGVLPERRKEGCLARMMATLESYSAPVLTICTRPADYLDMWQWLIKRGWSVERDMGGAKVMLSKRINVREENQPPVRSVDMTAGRYQAD